MITSCARVCVAMCIHRGPLRTLTIFSSRFQNTECQYQVHFVPFLTLHVFYPSSHRCRLAYVLVQPSKHNPIEQREQPFLLTSVQEFHLEQICSLHVYFARTQDGDFQIQLARDMSHLARSISNLCALVSDAACSMLLSESEIPLFLQTHRETDRFFTASGVQLAQTDRGIFHYRSTAFSSMLKSRVGNILAKAAALRVTLNLEGAPITSKSVYTRRVNSLFLVCSLSSHRHSYIGLIFSSRFIDS